MLCRNYHMLQGKANIYRVQCHIFFMIATIKYIHCASKASSHHDIVLIIGYNKEHFAVICTEDIMTIVENFLGISSFGQQNSTCPHCVISYIYTKM